MYQISDKYCIHGFSFNNEKLLKHNRVYKSLSSSYKSDIIINKPDTVYALVMHSSYFYSSNSYESCIYLSDSIKDIIFNGSKYCEGNLDEKYSNLYYRIYVIGFDQVSDHYSSYKYYLDLNYIDCGKYILFNLDPNFLDQHLDQEEKINYLKSISHNPVLMSHQLQQTGFNIKNSKDFIYFLHSIKDPNSSLDFSLIQLINLFHSSDYKCL